MKTHNHRQRRDSFREAMTKRQLQGNSERAVHLIGCEQARYI